jgi:Mn-containing catalase
LVATAINTMLTGASPEKNGRSRSELATTSPLADVKGIGNPHHFLAGGQGALPQDSNGRPWNGDYVFASGDLVEDLTHNFFLETGARNNKLKVYEMVDHPAARALTGYLLVRGGVHQIAYARALENLTGADLTKMFPTPRIPTDKIPECRPHIERGDHLRLYRFSPSDYQELAAVFNGPNPETGEELVVVDEAPEGVPPRDLPPQPSVFAPDYAPEEIAEIAKTLRERAGLPKEPTGMVADLEEQAKASTRKATRRSKTRA